MPGFSPRNLRSSAGLRDSSSLTLSGLRSGEATAAPMLSARAACLARSAGAGAAANADTRARYTHFFMAIPPFTTRALVWRIRSRQAVFDQRTAWRDRRFRARLFESPAIFRGFEWPRSLHRLSTARHRSGNFIREWRSSWSLWSSSALHLVSIFETWCLHTLDPTL